MKIYTILCLTIKYGCRVGLALIVFFFASIIFSAAIGKMIPVAWIDWVHVTFNFREGIEGFYDAWELLGFIFTLPITLTIAWLTFHFSNRLPFLRA